MGYYMDLLDVKYFQTTKPQEIFSLPWYKRILCRCKKTEDSNTADHRRMPIYKYYQCNNCGRWWRDLTKAEIRRMTRGLAGDMFRW